MENKIAVPIKITAEDYKSLIFFNMFMKKKAKFYFFIVVAVLSLGAIICRITGAVSMSDWYFYVCLAYLGLLVLEYLIFEFAVRRFLVSDKVVVGSDRTMVIDGCGITMDANDSGFTAYKWEDFYSAYETRAYCYIFVNTAMALILPKRNFKEEELLAVKALIKEKLGRKYHGK